MVNNTLGDLNNFLFGQLERLDNPDLSNDELEVEIKRSEAMNKIAKSIVDNGQLVLNAMKFNDDRMDADARTPRMLTGD